MAPWPGPDRCPVDRLTRLEHGQIADGLIRHSEWVALGKTHVMPSGVQLVCVRGAMVDSHVDMVMSLSGGTVMGGGDFNRNTCV